MLGSTTMITFNIYLDHIAKTCIIRTLIILNLQPPSIVRTLIIIMNKIKQCKIIYSFHYLVWIAERAMGGLLLDALIPPLPARNNLGINIYDREFIKYNNTSFAKLRGCLFTWCKAVRGWKKWLGSSHNNQKPMDFGGY